MHKIHCGYAGGGVKVDGVDVCAEFGGAAGVGAGGDGNGVVADGVSGSGGVEKPSVEVLEMLLLQYSVVGVESLQEDVSPLSS